MFKDWIAMFLMTIAATVLVWSLIVMLVASLGCEKQAPARPPQPEPPTPAVEVVAFTAAWCEPCKRAKPILDQIERAGALVWQFDVDEYPERAKNWGVKAVPTFFLFRPDCAVLQLHNAAELLRLVQQALGKG